jgi:hypothetical protein
LLAGIVLAACAGMTSSEKDYSQETVAMLKASFKERGQAKLDRLDQDDMQRLCSQYQGKPMPKDVSDKLERAQQALIKYPADGKYLGDFRSGERIAQSGQGKQFNDNPRTRAARTATPATSSPRPRFRSAPSARRSTTSARSAASRRRCRSTRTARSTTRKRVLGVLQHAALRPQRILSEAQIKDVGGAADGSRVADQQVRDRVDGCIALALAGRSPLDATSSPQGRSRLRPARRPRRPRSRKCRAGRVRSPSRSSIARASPR